MWTTEFPRRLATSQLEALSTVRSRMTGTFSPKDDMTLRVEIQAKAEQILESEAGFYGVNATALAKAIIDKVAAGGLIRDVLQGVDVASYQNRRRGRPMRRVAQ